MILKLIVEQSEKAYLPIPARSIDLGRVKVTYNQFDNKTVLDASRVGDKLFFIMSSGKAPIFHIDGDPVDCRKRGAIISRAERVLKHCLQTVIAL